MKYDFSGWATRANLKCADGRVIMRDAFKDNDGKTVPLIWGHQHDDPDAVLGHALLENRGDGVYAYCTFNDTESGRTSKELVQHGDVVSLSIYANQLKQSNECVIHGNIRELSLVLAGANPGAMIDSVICHGLESDEEAIMYTGENIELFHAEPEEKESSEPVKEENNELKHEEEIKMAEKEKTIGDVFETLTEEQKQVVYALIGQAVEDAKNENNGEDDADMKHNIFDTDAMNEEQVLSHDAMKTIIDDGKRYGSLKESFLAHADEYGIEDIETLFPEPTELNNTPEFIGRDMDWVSVVMNGVHHSPMSRVKTRFADITEDEARAKGYIKGSLKKEEVFSLLKRATTPTTIYKKQKLDRDDVLDITDFDVLTWIKGEMRMMLNEEIARAIIFGDGRLASDDDKINETNIRPVINDADLFVIRWGVSGSTAEDQAKNFIKAAVKARKNYRGSGNPILITTEDKLTDMLLLEDSIGHKLYKTEAELATALRVSKIITCPFMDTVTVKDSQSQDKAVYGVILNLNDYNVGADKGGAVSMFEDFDIDYNQQKYLLETRCSGALVKPFSAIVLRENDATESLEPTMANAMAPFKN